MDLLKANQQSANRTSADRWELFAGHRERVTGLIVDQLSATRGRVCILGAGNCNDVDLARLVARAEVDLVDIDGDALETGVARQLSGERSGVRVYGGVDVTGVWPRLDGLSETPDPAEIRELANQAAQGATLPLPGGYDVVVSPALLTQLIETAVNRIGRTHPEAATLAMSIREGHIRTLLQLVRPGGRVLMMTEVISNRELPALAEAADEQLGGLAQAALLRQNVYLATQPAAIISWLMAHRPLNGRLAAPGIAGPWRWWLSRTICYLVIGFILTRD